MCLLSLQADLYTLYSALRTFGDLYFASTWQALCWHYMYFWGEGKLPEHSSCIGEWGEVFWLLFLFEKLGTDPRTLCMLGICVCVSVCRYICIYTNIKIYTFIFIYLNKMAQIYKKKNPHFVTLTNRINYGKNPTIFHLFSICYNILLYCSYALR